IPESFLHDQPVFKHKASAVESPRKRRVIETVLDSALWAGYLVGGERGVEWEAVQLVDPESAVGGEGHGIKGHVLGAFPVPADTDRAEGGYGSSVKGELVDRALGEPCCLARGDVEVASRFCHAEGAKVQWDPTYQISRHIDVVQKSYRTSIGHDPAQATHVRGDPESSTSRVKF